MGYGRGNWPGNGPYSNLPPWQRPGWLYGRGACRYIYGAPYITPIAAPQDEAAILNEQKTVVEAQIKAMQETLAKIQERLDAIKK
ncbi:MAG: hypothetical protein ACQCN4_13075 [Candidatus Bathyarchaeia archaeon]